MIYPQSVLTQVPAHPQPGLLRPVIIASRNIHKYFQSMEFPVQVLEERADRVAYTLSKAELLDLITVECVIGVGSWRRIRHLRLNRPLEKMAEIRLKFKSVPAPQKFTVMTHLAGGTVFSHHAERCSASRPDQPRLTRSVL